MAISDKIREARQSAGLTQEEAAEQAFGSAARQSHWSQYETGAVCPDIPTLRRIAEALGVKIATLVSEE